MRKFVAAGLHYLGLNRRTSQHFKAWLLLAALAFSVARYCPNDDGAAIAHEAISLL
ncbi:MAG: hypothetical protein VW202_06610 [Halieaceae bacterium]